MATNPPMANAGSSKARWTRRSRHAIGRMAAKPAINSRYQAGWNTVRIRTMAAAMTVMAARWRVRPLVT